MNLRELIKTHRTSHDSSNTLDILFATSDIAPFSTQGEIATIAQQLPKALSSKRHRVTIITPLYNDISTDAHHFSKRLTPIQVALDDKKKVSVTIWEKNIDLSVRIVFMDYSKILGSRDKSEKEQAEMYAFFSRAVIAYMKSTSLPFDLVHCNDWQMALIPEYLKEEKLPAASVLSIYNLETGTFTASQLKKVKLPKKYKKSFLATGIKSADKIMTVSNGMRDALLEMKTGVERELTARKTDFVGLLNGVDYALWNPAKDAYLVHPFELETLNGKRLNKVALQHEVGLPIRPTQPLVGFIGDFTKNSGIEVFIKAMRVLLREKTETRDNLQVVILGDGEETYKRRVQRLVKDYPHRVFASFEFSDELLHHHVASSDILAIPSEFEPAGTLQIYAMRYGTLPLVHNVGGLKDTVKDADEHEDGTGFTYDKQTPVQITKTMHRAIDKYRVPRQWRPLLMNAMQADFSWEHSASYYEKLYFSILR